MNPNRRRANAAYLSMVFILIVLLLANCAPPPTPAVQPPAATAPPAGAAGLANPASQNCTKQGGKLTIETRPDGGQFGVCTFADNQQCEEWALFRGNCPVGGLKVTGYVTPAGRYCAITGGHYTDTGNSNAQNEQGNCALPGGKVCDATEYYMGACTP